MEKDHIYFLHIPKAGGHWVLREIIDIVSRDIFVFDKVAHYAWKPVLKSTYLISSWRDPAKRTVSHYCWLVSSGLIPESKLTVNDFFEWVDENKAFLSNFQSKNILSSGDGGGMFFSGDKVFRGINNIDEEILLKRIKSIEIFLRDNQMNPETAKNAVEKIYSDFPNNQRKQRILDKSRDHNKNVDSEILFNKLNQEEIETLYYLSPIDCSIYFNDDLFWNGGQ